MKYAKNQVNFTINIIIDNKIYTDYLLGVSDKFNGFDEVDCLLNYHLLEE